MDKVYININNKKLGIDLENNSTTSALIKLLPLELSMNDLNGNEKYVYLDESLPTNTYSPKHIEAGDVMYDNALYFSEIAEKKSRILEEVGVKPGEYALSTVHRDFNTDSPERLDAIFKALSYIAENKSVPVVMPLHPRTRKHLPPGLSSNIHVIPPASFFDILNLEKNAKLVITDSGGVQKEAFFFSKPCIILRPETEWVEIVENGAGILADADYQRIIEAYGRLAGTQVVFPPLYGNGDSSERILSEIVVYLG